MAKENGFSVKLKVFTLMGVDYGLWIINTGPLVIRLTSNYNLQLSPPPQLQEKRENPPLPEEDEARTSTMEESLPTLYLPSLHPFPKPRDQTPPTIYFRQHLAAPGQGEKAAQEREEGE